MYASQLDGISTFSAGSFTSSQSTQSADSPASNRDKHGVIPVTVKQISEASHSGDEKSNFVVSGVDVVNAVVVGIVSNMVERVTDISFMLDDGTGRIEIKRWLNELSDKKEMEGIEDGMYVHVIGHLRNFRGERHLTAFSVRPVTNFDEISFHFIQCIHFHFQNSKVQMQGNVAPQHEVVISTPTTPIQDRTNVYKNALSSQLSTPNADGLKGFDQMVLDYLQLPQNFAIEKGVHTDEIAQKLKLPIEKINESIRTLEDEGMIYSTVDEFHYKATTSS